MKRAAQPFAALSQQPQGDTQIAGQPREIPLHERTYLSSSDTVAYLGLPSLDALQHRMKRGTIPAWTWTRIGRNKHSLRFLRAALDQWLGQKFHAAEAAGLVHGQQSARSRGSFLLKKTEKGVA